MITVHLDCAVDDPRGLTRRLEGGLQRRGAYWPGAPLAQGALKALSGRDVADVVGDVGYATPGIGAGGRPASGQCTL